MIFYEIMQIKKQFNSDGHHAGMQPHYKGSESALQAMLTWPTIKGCVTIRLTQTSHVSIEYVKDCLLVMSSHVQ
jgi:hypothetical protein